METYTLAETVAQDVTETLKTMIPNARLTLDSASGKLVAWCTPSEHKMIKETIEKLDGEGTPATTRQLQTYALTKVEPKTAVELLQTILPDARLASDVQTRSMIALAVPADHEIIRRTLQQLQPQKAGAAIPELRYYPLATEASPHMIEVLKKTVPGATVALEAAGERLLVVAVPGEHDKIKKTVDQISSAVFAKLQSKLVVYPVTAAQRKRFDAVLATLSSRLPGVKVIKDAEPGELAIWAKPPQHEVITEILAELKHDVPDEERFRLVAYPVKLADSAGVLEIMQSAYPETKFVFDEENRALLAWARQAEQDGIKLSVEQLGNTAREADGRELRMYPFPYSAAQAITPNVGSAIKRKIGKSGKLPAMPSPEPKNLIEALKQLVPEAQFTVDSEIQQILVVATVPEHEIIKTTLDAIAAEIPAEEPPRFETYRLRETAGASLLASLGKLVPEARLTVNKKSGNLVVWGTPDDHVMLDQALGTLRQGSATRDGQRRLEVYRLTKAEPVATMKLLREILPDAELSVDPKAGRLVALAVAADQQVIKATLDRLQPDAGDPDSPQLEYYALTETPSPTLLTALKQLVPKAQITVEPEGKRLLVVATEADHAIIKSTVDQAELTTTGGPKLQFYPLAQTASESLLGVLKQMAPNAQITTEADGKRLMVVATETDHAIIKTTIEQVETTLPPEERARLVVYPVTPAQRARFTAILSNVAEDLPGVKTIEDTEPGVLSVWAKPTQHVVIAGLVDQLKTKLSDEAKHRFASYQLKSADPDSVMTVMEKLFPNIQTVMDKRARRLSVWASSTDQEAVKSAIEQMDTGSGIDMEEKVMIHEFPAGNPVTAQAVLTELFPDVKFQADPTAKTLIAIGIADDQEKVKAIVDQLKGKVPAGQGNQLIAYTIQSADPQSVLTVLQDLFPGVHIVLDEKTDRLAIYASPSEHAAIKAAIEQLDSAVPGGSAETFKVYPLPKTGSKAIMPMLIELVPNMQIGVDTLAGTIVARGRQGDHDKVAAALEQMQSGPDQAFQPELIVYPLGDGAPTALQKMLANLVPDAQIIPDTKKNTLNIMATPRDHETIKATIAKMTEEPEEGNKPTTVVYTAEARSIYGAIAVLRQVAPKAVLTPGSEPQQIIAWARPTDHERLKEAIDQMATSDGPDASMAVAYRLNGMRATQAIAALRAAVPGARCTTGSDPQQLIAWARSKDHEKIKNILAQMEGPEAERPKTVIYTLNSGRRGSYSAYRLLRGAVPGATVTIGDTPGQLIVFARPDELGAVTSVAPVLLLKIWR